jgi:hypothetical protein
VKIRRPSDVSIANACWLARFVDKIRCFLNGSLSKDYAIGFCHPKGIDGIFLDFFGLSKDELIEAVRVSGEDDSKIAVWFSSQEGIVKPKIDEWNQLAFNLGKPGFPAHEVMRWGLKNIYVNCKDPKIDSVFKLLDWDEGRLADI